MAGDRRWQKSTHSGISDCVEVARDAEGVRIRDSEYPDGAVLDFTTAAWQAFIAGVKDGEFDLT
jgi:hypothetical protein